MLHRSSLNLMTEERENRFIYVHQNVTPNEHVQKGHIRLKTFETSQQGSYLDGVTPFSPSTGLWLLSPSFLIPFTWFAAVLALHVCSELALLSFRVSRSLALLHSSLCFLSSSTSFCNCSQRAFSCSKLSNFWVYNLCVVKNEIKKKINSLSMNHQIMAIPAEKTSSPSCLLKG